LLTSVNFAVVLGTMILALVEASSGVFLTMAVVLMFFHCSDFCCYSLYVD
jgi:hypothetical protein